MSGQSQLANEDDEVPVELLGSTKLLWRSPSFSLTVLSVRSC